MIFYKSDDREINLLERKDYIAYLGNVEDGMIKNFEIPLNGIFLLSVVNSYAAGGLLLLESGIFAGEVKITSIRHSGNYLHVSSENNHSIKMQANGASYEIYLIKLFI